MLLRILVFFFLITSSYSIKLCKSFENSKYLRVIGGRNAETRILPWQAALIIYDMSGNGMLCGGTVIDERWILTAAHCVQRTVKSIYVLTGVSSLDNPKYSVKAHSYLIHPNYDPVNIFNDIALVRTSSSLLKKTVQPICLTNDDTYLTKPGKESYATGFGLHFDNTTNHVLVLSNVLLATQLPIISQNICTNSWYQMTLGTVRITNKQLCAGSLFHGTSPGDSGGPLFVIDDFGQEVQVGITSFGASGLRGIVDQKTFPGVYTRVSKYIDWIEAVTSSGTDLKLYGLILISIFAFIHHHL